MVVSLSCCIFTSSTHANDNENDLEPTTYRLFKEHVDILMSYNYKALRLPSTTPCCNIIRDITIHLRDKALQLFINESCLETLY